MTNAMFLNRPRAYWVKLIFAMIVTLSLSWALGSWFERHYRLATDVQKVPCMDARVLLIDISDTTPEVGALMAFRASVATEPLVKRGTLMAKRIAAAPGDTVRITRQEVILVNGKFAGVGLPHLKGVDWEKQAQFFGSRMLKDNQWWVLGEHPKSFDSRYWGSIGREQMVGRAYVLF